MTVTPYLLQVFERDSPGRQILALLGEDPPTPQDGGGGHEVVPLPKRSAVTVWRGRGSLLSMSVPIVLGSATHSPVTPARSALMSMWRPADATDEPPPIRLRSPGDAVPFQSVTWVLTGLEWGAYMGDGRGNRVMQKLVLTVTEYRPDEQLQIEVIQAKQKWLQVYTVRVGDTLSSIARKFRVKGGWRAIGDIQHPPIRDPRKVRVGQRLLIP